MHRIATPKNGRARFTNGVNQCGQFGVDIFCAKSGDQNQFAALTIWIQNFNEFRNLTGRSSSADFYADCRRTLTDDGCMTVNLFGRSSSFERSVERIASAFGRDAIWAFKATRQGNTVVLAQRTATRPPRATWAARGEYIQEQWGLPARQWVRVLKPVV